MAFKVQRLACPRVSLVEIYPLSLDAWLRLFLSLHLMLLGCSFLAVMSVGF